MSTPVPLPALGESVTEGTVSRWLKQVGDTVEVDEPIVEVSTDKVDTEIPAPAAGVILEIKVAEDEVAAVGAVLAVIGDPSEASGSAGGAPAAPAAAEDVPAEEADAEEPDAPDVAEAPSTEAPAPKAASESSGSGGGGGTEVTLPQLGESVTEGTISRWLKAVGDTVEADEPIVEVSTDKVDTEIPAPTGGVLLEIRVNEDETAAVGAVIAVIGEPGAAPAEAQAPSDAPEVADETPAEPRGDGPSEAEEKGNEQAAKAAGSDAPSPAQDAPEAAPSAPAASAPAAKPDAADQTDFGYVTPLVRKLAAQHGVELAGLTGTGVGGRIRKQDVLAAAESARKAAEAPAPAAAPEPAAAPAPAAAPSAAAPSAPAAPPAGSKRGSTEKISRMRSVIAKRMVESLQISAQLTGTVEVDFTNISKLRARAKDDFKKREGASLSYLPFICKAVCEALKQFDKINATMDVEAGTITYHNAEHLGVAVDTERGLLVPVIRDAGDLSLAGLAKKIGDVAARSRGNKISPDELSGGTFTITNYGSAGTLFDTPIINQPQAAILGTGALVKRPMVVSDPVLGDVIAVRDMMYLSLSYDHRLVDGADAARFLSVLKARLEAGDFGGELGL
jgi:2-oxoglutarate dehydrogenase E2 component (dihydrolipoamide succinyltransferase)